MSAEIKASILEPVLDPVSASKNLLRSGGAPRWWQEQVVGAVKQVPDLDNYSAWTTEFTKVKTELSAPNQWKTLATVLRQTITTDETAPWGEGSKHHKRTDASQLQDLESARKRQSTRRLFANRGKALLDSSDVAQRIFSNSPTVSDSRLQRMAKLTDLASSAVADHHVNSNQPVKKSALQWLNKSARPGSKSIVKSSQLHGGPTISDDGLNLSIQEKTWQDHLCQRTATTLQKHIDKWSAINGNAVKGDALGETQRTVNQISDQLKASLKQPELSSRALANYVKRSESVDTNGPHSAASQVDNSKANDLHSRELMSDYQGAPPSEGNPQRRNDETPGSDDPRIVPSRVNHQLIKDPLKDNASNRPRAMPIDIATEAKNVQDNGNRELEDDFIEPPQAAATLEPLVAPESKPPTALGAASVRSGSLQDQLETAEDLNGLAANLKRILDAEARRHGIDV